MPAFDTFLADPSAERCWLLEIDALAIAPVTDGSQVSAAFSDAAFGEVAFSEGGSTADESGTLYYSSHGFRSQAADAPPYTWYAGRLSDDVVIERKIYGRDGIGGLTRVYADCSLLNSDGGLDTLQASYALDGRQARLLIGRPTDARSAFNLVFSGVVEVVDSADANYLRLRLSDGAAKLGVPLNSTVYAGTGALEGGSDLKGKPKPRVWGSVLNLGAPLVDSALLIYQVNDGAINDVPAVYDRGVVLTKGADYVSQADMQTNAPTAGQYRVWKAGGFYRLGSTPAGTCTADVLGDASGAGYVSTTADILQRILLLAAIDSSLVDAAALTQLNVDAPATIGIATLTESKTVEDLVEALLAGIGAYGGFSRLNLFTAAVFKSASGAPADSYTEQHVFDIRRDPLPAAVEPAVWRARVGYQHNYTMQTDLAASVTAARRAFAAEADRVEPAQDLTVKSQRLLAKEYGPTGNLYSLQADAATEALRLLNLWKTAPGFYWVRVAPIALARDLGDVINLTCSRYGFAGGKLARIVAHKVAGSVVELTVLA
jgi:hypothetical protein